MEFGREVWQDISTNTVNAVYEYKYCYLVGISVSKNQYTVVNLSI
jgi:hypothetical protein